MFPKRLVFCLVALVLVVSLGAAVTPAAAATDLEFACAWMQKQQPRIYMAAGQFELTQYDVIPCGGVKRITLPSTNDPRGNPYPQQAPGNYLGAWLRLTGQGGW